MPTKLERVQEDSTRASEALLVAISTTAVQKQRAAMSHQYTALPLGFNTSAIPTIPASLSNTTDDQPAMPWSQH